MMLRRFRPLLRTSRSAGHSSAARRGLLIRTTRAFAAGCAWLVAAGCSNADGPSAGTPPRSQPVQFALSSNVSAAAGAVIGAVVSYQPPDGAVVTLARDSIVVGSAETQAPLPLEADVSDCRRDAESVGATCTIVFTLRLTRDGRLLDENVQQIPVSATTQLVNIPDISLFEVATVTIAPALLTGVEVGDTQTLTATAADRSGAVVTGRQTTWEVVSGNVTISTTGALQAVGTGDARIRASIGGRQRELAFAVGQASVATLQLAPLDTLVPVGGSATYRIVARSASGEILTGRPVTYSSSNPSVATIAGSVASALSVGTSTITARSTEGRGGTTITASTPLRVEAAPPILVDRTTVALDSLAPGTTGTARTVAVSTSVGRTIGALRATITYVQSVTPWLTATLNATTTPTSLSLQAAAGQLPAGDYAADVRLTSASEPHQPATVRVTLRVVPARRVTLTPRVVDLGTFDPTETSGEATFVSLTSSNTFPVAGLSARIEYLTAATGWLTTALEATTAPPATRLVLTPRPFGLALGAHQARVIVSSTSLGASPDTAVVSMTVSQSALGRFAGLIVNPVNGSPLANVSVSIRRASDSSEVALVTSASNGSFTSGPLPAGAYLIVYSASGFVASTLESQTLVGGVGAPIRTLPTAQMVPVGLGAGTITGFVRDATTANPVVGATVELRIGSGNTTGPVLATTTTNSGGGYSFAAQQSRNYTIRGSRQGFVDGSVNVAVYGTTVVAPLTFLSPGTGTIAWRFVLSWGSQPSDLDAYLTGPIASSAQRFVVYFGTSGSLVASPFAQLDIDRTTGFGPETITMAQQITGVYRYYVNNFSQQPSITVSNARVDVYQGNTLFNQFFIPQGSGTYWTVFELSGSTLTPINTIGTSQPSLLSPISGRRSAAADVAREAFSLFPPFPTQQKKPR
ncbi:MAG: carboxypeptidase regulatory-like domain-containing protein [Gemmatimonadaceae bacterium]|nr:carboxypeptidase regulatory-like domain-containing protein [Gemmatimonadaceae bacterium]